MRTLYVPGGLDRNPTTHSALERFLPIPWNADPPGASPVLEKNLRDLLREIVSQARRREAPTLAMAQEWHRRIYRGIVLPVTYYAGEIRDSDRRFPELYGYEVQVGAHSGVPSRDVPDELERFEQALRQAVGILDPRLSPRERSGESSVLHSVVTLCAHAHGEWVRIHPFANGNGRTARLWANWCSLRYGLPPFVRLRPRPEGWSYAAAAADSMQGDHRAMTGVFLEMLERRLM